MSKLVYRTLGNEKPQGKPNVYFSCHPEDLESSFEVYASKILKIQDCAVWYESEPDAEYNADELEMDLSQMQLFVIPVSAKLLTAANRSMDVEYPFAVKKHIPVLPLMIEQGLEDIYRKHFGNLQYLDPNNNDPTKQKFDEALEIYIKSILVGNELAAKIRAAFDAYIFLSYRKKDRVKAQELMRLIHKNPVCRDIAIWYDEFLTPGEDFNHAIKEMLEKSDLFTMVITPNLVNEVNYVMTTEYPAALELKKPVLPVEMEGTDQALLKDHYEELPSCVSGTDETAVWETLIGILKELAISSNDTDQEHNFLIGLAYLDGIDVEVDSERAFCLIKGAAEAGVPEAVLQLVTMYETGKGVERDYHKSIEWREKYVDIVRAAYLNEKTERSTNDLIYQLGLLGDAYYGVADLDRAEAVYQEMQTAAMQQTEEKKEIYIRWFLSGMQKDSEQADRPSMDEYYETVKARRNLSLSYDKLGSVAEEKGDLSAAQGYFEKSLALSDQLANETETSRSRRDRSIVSERLGFIAQQRGDLEGAQKYYRYSVAVCEDLYKKTGSIQARRDLSVIYEKLASLAQTKGDDAEADRLHKESFEIRKNLSEETGTVQARRDLSISYNQLGVIAYKKGNVNEARECYEECMAIREKLVEELGTIESFRDLSLACALLGIVYREGLQDKVKSKELLERVIELGENSSDKKLTEYSAWAKQLLEQ
ncbi:MAG: TIR domain-containing protein [Firmicutes bacterium]|nr:TIR domain-containing protein [Bacillota bacterium]